MYNFATNAINSISFMILNNCYLKRLRNFEANNYCVYRKDKFN